MVAAYPANDFSACATTSAGTAAGIFPRIWPIMRVCSTPINPSCAAAAAVQGWIGESSGPVNARRGPLTPAARIRARASRSEIRNTWGRRRCSVR